MFSSPLTFSFCSPVKRPVGVGVMALPPVTENLLAFLRGNSSETEKLDSYKKPLAENFVMSQAPCIEVNGVDNDGTTDIDHGAIVSSEGSATVAYDGTTLSFSTAGTFYNVTFADGTHFACAETSGLHSFSTDGQHTITWTGVEAELRAGRQDTYFYNDVHGFGYRENVLRHSGDFNYVDWWTFTNGATSTKEGSAQVISTSADVGIFLYSKFSNVIVGEDYTFLVKCRSEVPGWLLQLRGYDDDYNGDESDYIPAEYVVFHFHCPDVCKSLRLYLSNGAGVVNNLTVESISLQKTRVPVLYNNGDSIAFKAVNPSGSSKAGCYAYQYVNYYKAEVDQQAVAGEELPEIAARLHDDLDGQHYSIAMCTGGTNDILDASEDPNDAMRAAIDGIVVDASAAADTVVILTCNTGPIYDDDPVKASWLASYNNYVIDTYADTVAIIDVDSVLDNETDYNVGGVHPNLQGHTKIFEAIKSKVTFPTDADLYTDYIETEKYELYGIEQLPQLTDNRVGTFNNSGTSFAPATTPVGTGNGVDMFIDLDEPYDFIDGDTVSFSFLKNADDIPIIGLSVDTSQYIRIQGEFLTISIDSATKSTDRGFINGVYYFIDIVRTGNNYAIYINDIYKTTISISGTMIGLHAVYRRGGAYANAITRNLKLGSRPVIPINEGSGYDIHDSLGNVVGALSGDETFWEGPEMVSDEIIKQETIKTTPVFTDGNGHPVPMTQEEWEANAEINTNKQDYLRTGIKTELAMYSEVQDTENDTKLLEWAGIIDNVYATVNLDGSQALNPDGSAAANPTT